MTFEVTVRGTVTRVDAEEACVELNGSVRVYFGLQRSYGGIPRGAALRAIRKGAKIGVHAVTVASLERVPTALFASAASCLELEEEAGSQQGEGRQDEGKVRSKSEMLCACDVELLEALEKSKWRSLWRRLSPVGVLLAREIQAFMTRAFWKWAPVEKRTDASNNKHEPEVDRAQAVSRIETVLFRDGLLRELLVRLANDGGISAKSLLPMRSGNVYTRFLQIATGCARLREINFQPRAPRLLTIAQVLSLALSIAAHKRAQHDAQVVVVTSEELSAFAAGAVAAQHSVGSKTTRENRALEWRRPVFALAQMQAHSATGSLRLCDSTGGIALRILCARCHRTRDAITNSFCSNCQVPAPPNPANHDADALVPCAAAHGFEMLRVFCVRRFDVVLGPTLSAARALMEARLVGQHDPTTKQSAGTFHGMKAVLVAHTADVIKYFENPPGAHSQTHPQSGVSSNIHRKGRSRASLSNSPPNRRKTRRRCFESTSTELCSQQSHLDDDPVRFLEAVRPDLGAAVIAVVEHVSSVRAGSFTVQLHVLAYAAHHDRQWNPIVMSKNNTKNERPPFSQGSSLAATLVHHKLELSSGYVDDYPLLSIGGTVCVESPCLKRLFVRRHHNHLQSDGARRVHKNKQNKAEATNTTATRTKRRATSTVDLFGSGASRALASLAADSPSFSVVPAAVLQVLGVAHAAREEITRLVSPQQQQQRIRTHLIHVLAVDAAIQRRTHDFVSFAAYVVRCEPNKTSSTFPPPSSSCVSSSYDCWAVLVAPLDDPNSVNRARVLLPAEWAPSAASIPPRSGVIFSRVERIERPSTDTNNKQHHRVSLCFNFGVHSSFSLLPDNSSSRLANSCNNNSSSATTRKKNDANHDDGENERRKRTKVIISRAGGEVVGNVRSSSCRSTEDAVPVACGALERGPCKCVPRRELDENANARNAACYRPEFLVSLNATLTGVRSYAACCVVVDVNKVLHAAFGGDDAALQLAVDDGTNAAVLSVEGPQLCFGALGWPAQKARNVRIAWMQAGIKRLELEERDLGSDENPDARDAPATKFHDGGSAEEGAKRLFRQLVRLHTFREICAVVRVDHQSLTGRLEEHQFFKPAKPAQSPHLKLNALLIDNSMTQRQRFELSLRRKISIVKK